uniref:Uncharacterized protein n=1 Tax=Avena sativa TaxID=4498 RepID=A0ACD6A8T3_AVESA
MPSVKIVEVARVAVPAATAAAALDPSSSLLCLSALDAPWLAFPLLQRVFIFDDAAHHPAVPAPFASRVASLRASLAATLARFPPLAGTIVFLPSTGDAAIDCSGSGPGVRFLVAEADDADAARLAGDADHDVDTFRRLVPPLDSAVLPAEALAVQATRLRGGVAVGVALHHAVVDGRSVWRFLEAWAAACRGDTADTTTTAPSFDRTAVTLPGGQELARSTLRKYMPDLPRVPQSPVGPIFPRRTFTVTQTQISRLKQRVADDLTRRAGASDVEPPSSFVAVAALSWASYIRSKHPVAISADHDVYVFFFVDCRGRRGFDPPVSQSYFGSCLTGCLAKAVARDLLGDDGVAAAAVAVQKEVRRVADDPLALWDWMSLSSSLPLDRVLNMSGSTRFQAYEAADFGWGAPSRTELVSMENPGQVVLVAAKGGGVQASAVMHADHMDTFSSHFGNFLS